MFDHLKAPEYSNVLLDFMDRSNRQLYRLYENSSKSNHARVLLEALNVAALLCDRFCICPPGPIAECEIARFTLSKRSEWFRAGLIKWPLRESGWDDFFDKKEREYEPFRTLYTDLYKPGVRRFFKQYPEAILHRETLIGRGIAALWESGPDVLGIWRELLGWLSNPATEQMRALPKQLLNDGIAVAWPAIEGSIPAELRGRPDLARAVLQQFRFKLYLREYNLRIVTSIPFATVDLRLGDPDLRYDFVAFKEALEALQLWSLVRTMSDSAILRLRSTPGYFAFRSAFDKVARANADVRRIGRMFAFAATAAGNRMMHETSIISQKKIVGNNWEGVDLSQDELEAVDFRLLASSEIINNGRIDFDMADIEATHRSGDTRNVVAIFTALQFERELLVKRWNLVNEFGESVWSGMCGKYRLLLYGPDEAGRVPAAVHTMAFLRKHQPGLILVLGIAGGFPDEKVSRGDVLIPDYIADLATRKIHEQKKKKDEGPEFRPRPFEVDPIIRAFTKSGSFNRGAWEQEVIDEASWPAGLRPTIHYGPVACLDEVVSSAKWQQSLLGAWPKLSGVEMESGGVFAAAKFSQVRVAVVRGVSDLADPRKSDDEWRRRAMMTIASLIELALATIEIAAPAIARK